MVIDMKCDICETEINKANIKYDSMIWVDKEDIKGVAIYKPYMSIKSFEEMCVRDGVKLKDVRMSFWCNPDGILKVLQDIDSKIQGWRIPNFTACLDCSAAGKKPVAMEI